MTRASKQATLAAWSGLTPNQPILPVMNAIPYKAGGSKYGACGIRIDGNPAFIDAVLSRLQDLIDGENHATRLELSRSEVGSVVAIAGTVKSFGNADHGANRNGESAEVCYIRLHQRGGEGQITSCYLNRHLDDATRRFAATRARK